MTSASDLGPRPRAGVYVRISSDPHNLGQGVERQAEDCRALCDARGWQVSKVYEDNDRSAWSARRKRPAYKRLLSAVEHGELDVIVAWHPDRLHRRSTELNEFIDLVERARVSVATVQAGQYDLTTAAGRMSARIVGAVAEHESEQKVERITRKLQQNAKDGKMHGGSRPYGWQADRIHADQGEQGHLQWAAREVLSGGSLLSTARRLNEERGARTATGKLWSAVGLRDALLRPRNAGIRTYHDEEVATGEWEPILSMDDFRKLQAILLNPSRVTTPGRGGVVHLLSTIARCGVCDSPMIVAKGRKYKGVGKPVYRCGNRSKAHVSRDKAQLDLYITNLVLVRMEKADIRELMNETAARSRSAKKVAEEIARLEADQVDMAHAHAAGRVTLAQLLAYNESVQPRIEELRRKTLAPDREAVLGDLVRAPDPSTVWSAWSPERRKSAVAALLTVRVHPVKHRAAWLDTSAIEVTWLT